MSESVTFDRAADFYDQTRAFPPGDERRAVALIARVGGWGAGARLLEIGVGTGRIALPLAAHARMVVGLDLARGMMARLVAKRRDERVLLVEGDATRLPLPTAALDGALAVHVFHLIPDWRGAVRELARVLRPGGRLVHCWSENFHRERWWAAWRAALPDDGEVNPGLKFRDQKTFLLDMGWTAAGSEAITYAYRQSPAGFLDQLQRRLWSTTWSVSDEDMARAVAAVRAAIEADGEPLDAEVPVEVRFHAEAYAPPAS